MINHYHLLALFSVFMFCQNYAMEQRSEQRDLDLIVPTVSTTNLQPSYSQPQIKLNIQDFIDCPQEASSGNEQQHDTASRTLQPVRKSSFKPCIQHVKRFLVGKQCCKPVELLKCYYIGCNFVAQHEDSLASHIVQEHVFKETGATMQSIPTNPFPTGDSSDLGVYEPVAKKRRLPHTTTTITTQQIETLHNSQATAPENLVVNHGTQSYNTTHNLWADNLGVLESPYEGCDYAAEETAHMTEYLPLHIAKASSAYTVNSTNSEAMVADDTSALPNSDNLHISSKPFKCDHPGCSYETGRTSNLKSHKQRMHNFYKITAVAVANQINDGVVTKAQTITVIADKNGQSDLNDNQPSKIKGKKYKCLYPGCKWAFPTASKLKSHQSTHTQEKPYPCSVPGCTYKAKRSYYLRAHLLSHTQEKLFICDYPGCGHKDVQKTNLISHMLRMHPDFIKQ